MPQLSSLLGVSGEWPPDDVPALGHLAPRQLVRLGEAYDAVRVMTAEGVPGALTVARRAEREARHLAGASADGDPAFDLWCLLRAELDTLSKA